MDDIALGILLGKKMNNVPAGIAAASTASSLGADTGPGILLGAALDNMPLGMAIGAAFSDTDE